MAKATHIAIVLVFILHAAGLCAQTTEHPWEIKSQDGKSSMYVGLLAQGQVEWRKTEGEAEASHDLFLRRFRFVLGGKITPKLSFFIDTDCPNLGKNVAGSGKVDDGIMLQDALFTYTFRPEIQIDGGMMLVALSHNTGQGATSLLAVDYGPYSFLASGPLGNRVGRDYGLQARGYLAKDHFEYRMGVFQGYRGTDATTPFRYSGRVVWYPFEAEKGYFYSGTSLGKRRVLALGAGFDHQQDYNTHGVDLFYDQPIKGGDGVTMQLNYMLQDGGSTLAALPRQHVWMAEAGYYQHWLKLGPFCQFSGRRFTDNSTLNENQYQGGIAFWPSGHRLNVKLGIGKSTGGDLADRWRVALQLQILVP